MTSEIRIGLIGDHDPAVTAHRAIPLALALAGEALGLSVTGQWVATERIEEASQVADFDGLWCVPASPYKSMAGALSAISYARVHGRPFLGTCAGFQHTIIEYARSVLGWADAEHAETAPDAPRAVIAPLACALVEVSETLRLREPSLIAAAYGRCEIREEYHCRYGLNPRFRAELSDGPLRIVAEDLAGEVRAVELDGHPFFLATLFQPERAALRNETPPPVAAFVQAAAAQAPLRRALRGDASR